MWSSRTMPRVTSVTKQFSLGDPGRDPGPTSKRFRTLPGRCALTARWVVGAIHGWAVGGGLEWTINCDFVVMANDARFFFPVGLARDFCHRRGNAPFTPADRHRKSPADDSAGRTLQRRRCAGARFRLADCGASRSRSAGTLARIADRRAAAGAVSGISSRRFANRPAVILKARWRSRPRRRCAVFWIPNRPGGRASGSVESAAAVRLPAQAPHPKLLLIIAKEPD